MRLPATEMAYDVAGLPRPGCFGHAPPVSDASSNMDTSCARGVKSRCMWPDAPARGRAWAAVRTSCCGTCCWPLLRACGCACMTTSQGFTAHASAPRRLFCDLCRPNAPSLLFWVASVLAIVVRNRQIALSKRPATVVALPMHGPNAGPRGPRGQPQRRHSRFAAPLRHGCHRPHRLLCRGAGGATMRCQLCAHQEQGPGGRRGGSEF